MANKTRKSLAVASTISLGIGSALVGFAPAANAVDPVSLEPLAGTSYTVSALDDFQLKALFTNAAVSGGAEVLKFRVVDADEGLTVNADSGSGYDQDGDDEVVEADNAPDNVVPALDADDKDAVVVTALTGGDEGTAAEFILVSAADATFSVTVQAWMDFDLDGVVDADEYKSPVRTVNFIKSADLDWTLTSVQPSLGDTNLEATLVSDDGINLSQTSAEVEIAMATYDAAGGNNKYTVIGVTEEDADGVFDVGIDTDADGLVEQAFGGQGVTAATYAFVGLYNGAEVTAEQFRIVGTGTAAAVAAPSLVSASNVKGVTIREDSNSVVVESAVTDADGDSVGAGYAATVTLSDVDLKADTSITAGGKTLSAGGDAVSFSAVTNADGKVSFTVSGLSAQDAGDSFNVAIKVDAIAAVNDDFDVTAEDTDSFVSHNLLGSNAVLKVTSGSSYTLTYAAVDNFDQPETRDMRVKLNDGGAVTKFADVRNGVAQFNVTDDADVDEVWTATLQIWNAADGVYEDEGIAAVAITPVVGTSNAASAITSIADEDVDLNLADLTAANTRLGETAPTVNNESSDITGVVTDSTGAGTYAQVTISAPGVLFEVVTDAGTNLYVLNSVTVSTNAAGVYAGVTAISNTSGDTTVTVSSGSASEDVVLTFAAAAEGTATAATLTVTNAAQGKTMTVSGVVTDKYGNVVDNAAGDIEITYTGPGFINGALPTQTDANGAFKFQVLIGAADTISGSVTVAVDGNSDNDFTDDNDFEVSKDLAPAAPAADTKVNAGSFKGYVAVYAKGHEGKRLSAKIGNDWVVVESLASNFERIVDFTGAGYTISVRIYIDRVLEDTIVVTTK
jgi:hypothetical protein